MNKIVHWKRLLPRGNTSIIQKSETGILVQRLFSVDKEKDKEEVEERYKGPQGVLHDKQQSIQEESFFHKESQEQLKALKKKVKKDQTSESDSNKN